MGQLGGCFLPLGIEQDWPAGGSHTEEGVLHVGRL